MAGTAAEVEEVLLGALQGVEAIANSKDWASSAGFDHSVVEGVVRSLHGFGYVDAENVRKVRWTPTAEVKNYTMRGSPEVQVFEAVPDERISLADLKGKLDALVYDVGFKTAMKNKWILSTKLNGFLQRISTAATDLFSCSVFFVKHRLNSELGRTLWRRFQLSKHVS